MRVFLTGATGYVGRRAAEELVGQGHELGVMVRGAADDAAARRVGAWPIRAGLEDLGRLREVAAEVDAIVHCSASDRPAFLPVNRAAVEAMLEGLRPGSAFVMHGGSLVFGDTGGRVFDGTEPFAPPPPLAGRAALDAAVLEAGRRRGLRAALVYASLCYGDGAGAVIPALMTRAALAAGWAGTPAGASPVWSSVHVADWAALIGAAVARTPQGGEVFLAAGHPWPLREVAALVARAAGLPPPREVAPEEAEAVWGPMGPALWASQHFTADRARCLLDWVPMEDGLEEELPRLAALLRSAAGPAGRA